MSIADRSQSKIAFVYIDTNFLAYGNKGEPHNKQMRKYFTKYKWNEKHILAAIEELLAKN